MYHQKTVKKFTILLTLNIYATFKTKNIMTYLNIKDPYSKEIETIDQFETRKEARKMLKEYRLASSYYSGLYLSQRSTSDWKQ